MKIKPSPELNLVITVLSVIAVILELCFVTNTVLKVIIAATIIFVGVLVETKIESAYLAQDK